MHEHQASTGITAASGAEPWPELPLPAWRATCDTLHMWTQIVGKIRMERSPLMNGWWNVPLYVTARGLTTSPIPQGAGAFEIDFDFVDHELLVLRSDGAKKVLPLAPKSVKSFLHELFDVLRSLDIDVTISTLPCEVPNPIPFEEDEVHASYDPAAVNRFHRMLVPSDTALKAFRARFTGKASPVQFYWGTFDLAVSLYSGRPAAPPAGSGRIARVAFAEEQFEAGFWPGDDRFGAPAYYAFTYPRPDGIERQPVRPSAAAWNASLGELILPYDAVRASSSPFDDLAAFFQSTYEAGATLAGWNRTELERRIAA